MVGGRLAGDGLLVEPSLAEPLFGGGKANKGGLC